MRTFDEDSHADESYFVSMTDLLVGMLFVFIILLMAFALNLRDQQQQVNSAADRLTKANLARKELLEELEQALKKDGVTVHIDVLNGVLRLPEEVLFSRGEYRLADKGRQTLRRLAIHLSDLLPNYACVPVPTNPRCPHEETAARLETILIEGHTDSAPAQGGIGTCLADNWALSACRATAVFNELIVSQDVLARLENDRLLSAADENPAEAATRENEKLLGVSGYADRRPVSKENMAANRRIDLRFIMSTPDLDEARRFKEKFGSKSAPQ
jgi:flagellar motor protein MotB